MLVAMEDGPATACEGGPWLRPPEAGGAARNPTCLEDGLNPVQILRPLEPEDCSALWEEKPLDIPKELWMMVDHLYRNACQQVRRCLALNRLLVGLAYMQWEEGAPFVSRPGCLGIFEICRAPFSVNVPSKT